MRKEVRQVIKLAEDHGFKYEGLTGSGHVRIRHRGGQMLIMPSSPRGGNRWRQNTISLIHRINGTKDRP